MIGDIFLEIIMSTFSPFGTRGEAEKGWNNRKF
jgi:hypothetical protein